MTPRPEMSFEDYIRTRIDSGAKIEIHAGRSAEGEAAGFMTSDNKVNGTCYWRVEGSTVTLIEFVSDDDDA